VSRRRGLCKRRWEGQPHVLDSQSSAGQANVAGRRRLNRQSRWRLARSKRLTIPSPIWARRNPSSTRERAAAPRAAHRPGCCRRSARTAPYALTSAFSLHAQPGCRISVTSSRCPPTSAPTIARPHAIASKIVRAIPSLCEVGRVCHSRPYLLHPLARHRSRQPYAILQPMRLTNVRKSGRSSPRRR